MSDDEATTLWHGRFDGGPDAALMAYTVSLPLDQRLWEDDNKPASSLSANGSTHQQS